MGALRGAAERIAASSSYPAPNARRRLRLELAEERLGGEGGGRGGAGEEPWARFAVRFPWARLQRARPRDVARAIGGIWGDEGRAALAEPLLRFAVEGGRKTWDRALILAYLRAFPTAHPGFATLARASAAAAARHDWPWRERGRCWLLWEATHGPERVGKALLRREDAHAVLREAGLDGDRREGGFVAAALADSCLLAGKGRGTAAERDGRKLIDLFAGLGANAPDAHLVYALLRPWAGANPSAEHRRALIKLLVGRLGDPRLAPARWAVVQRELSQLALDFDPAAPAAVLRRWLTEQAVRAFFKIVAATTNNREQWAAREEFWLAYLDAGLIVDAWFAFGRDAEARVRSAVKEQGLQYGRVVGGGDASYSSLIMTIGDLRIAEWSHNGSCRFWPKASSVAPQLFKHEYDGTKLRKISGPEGFRHLPHAGAWQFKFANLIHQRTGARHPDYGAGY